MKTTGYIQLTARDLRADGSPMSLKFARVSTRYPRDPLPGAIVVKLTVEVPDELLNLQAEVLLDIEEAMVAKARVEELEPDWDA